MRSSNKNKQTLYYALYKGQEIKYRLDEDGNKILSYVDDSTEPPTNYYEEDGVKEVYEKAVKFKGNISYKSNGEAQPVEYGVSVADYEAVLMTEKNSIPITETSLIWHNTKPTTDTNGYPNPATADFTVVKVSPSLNEDRYVLAKVVK